jgi:hypothetical protein
MWEYGHDFHIEYVDDGHMTQDPGMEVEFDQSSCVGHHDQNLIQGKLGYIGKIQEIIQVHFSSFDVLFLVVSDGTPFIGIM